MCFLFYPIRYVNTLEDGSETTPNFDDFISFANFKKPTVKQFAKYYRICGLLVNRLVNFYFNLHKKPFLFYFQKCLPGHMGL